jgi:hypothetical protein
MGLLGGSMRLALLAILAVGSVQAGTLRVALLAETQVQGDAIFLVNLLPRMVPANLRNAADNIPLGTSPQSGTTRILSRSAILSAIEGGGLLTSAFAVPEIVRVQRAGRILTRDEVYSAIQSALRKTPIEGISPFEPEGLCLEAAVHVPPGDARLEVTQITFDQAIGRARFRLWPQSAPEIVPFYVTARIPFGPKRGTKSPISAVIFDAHGAPRLSSPVLVEGGHYARLHLHSQNSNMILEVKPLERGHLGETIRVRLPVSGKTLQARVVGSGDLDASF